METFSGGNRSLFVDEEVDVLSLCERIAHDIGEVVKHENLLNQSQCRELSSMISEMVENLRALNDVERESSGLTFLPFLPILYQSLEKAKLLVSECAEEDWIARAVFQGRNESSFREILRDVGLCYNAIFDNVWNYPIIERIRFLRNFLRSSWLWCPSDSTIESDQEDLRRRLERFASDSSSVKAFSYFLGRQGSQKQCLARHLLKKFSCACDKCVSKSSDVCKASLWEKKMGSPETWGNSEYLGSGSGGSGVCVTRWLGVPCAKKEFHYGDLKGIFLKEVSILSHLKHPRIVNFICCGNGEAKGDRFIAMELMEKSLFDVIEERKGALFALPVAVDIIVQIAEGMRYLHGRGVAHRDLKPQNVVVNRLMSTHLVDQYYCVKLIDFGISKTKVEVSNRTPYHLEALARQGTGLLKFIRMHTLMDWVEFGGSKWMSIALL